MRPHIAGPTLVGLMALLAVPGIPWAGALSVSPVRVALSARQPVGSIVVHNDSTEPAVVQLNLVDWSQTGSADGEDVYVTTAELLATPPIFTIAPGASRVVRVGLRRQPDSQRELTYRLYLQEIPPPLDADFRGTRMALKIGIPVFVASAAKTRPQLTWRAIATPEGLVRLSLANSGSEHVKVTDLELVAGDGAHGSGLQRVSTYVLPGHSREWFVRLDTAVAPGTTVRLKAHTDSAGEQAASLTLDPS